MGRMAKRLIHDVVWWESLGADAAGEPTYAPPVPTRGRWVVKGQEIITPQGTTIKCQVEVITDRLMKEQDILWKGLVAGLADPARPMANIGAFRIQMVRGTPDNRGTETVFRAFL